MQFYLVSMLAALHSIQQSSPLECTSTNSNNSNNSSNLCHDSPHRINAGKIVPLPEPVFAATSNTLSPPPSEQSDQHARQAIHHELTSNAYANKTAIFKKIIKREINLTHGTHEPPQDNKLILVVTTLNPLNDELKSISVQLNESIIEYANGTDDATCDEHTDENCIIDHTQVCVGDQDYCNYTYDEYMGLLYDYITPTTSEWILIVSHAIVFIMGLVGNALVCIAVYTNHSMRTVTNIFIVNLAVADFFVILFCLPPTVLWDVTETWFFGEAMCKIVLYFQTVSVTVSVLTLTFISIDRWYAICFPLRYKPKPERAWRSIGFIWFIGFVLDVPEFLVLKTKRKKLRFGSTLFTQCIAEWEMETERTYNIVKLVFLYAIPLLIMAIAYFKIVRVLWRSDTIPGHRESRNHGNCTIHSTRTTLSYHANSTTMGQLRARRKAAKMLVAVVLLFASCYFPVHALNVARYATNMEQNEVISVLSLLSHWLCYANSACNPVIYNFMSGKFRREFKNALEKCKCLRSNHGMGGRVGGYEERSMYQTATRVHMSPSQRSNYHLASVNYTAGQTQQTSFNGNNANHHIVPPLTTASAKAEERVALTTALNTTTNGNHANGT